jgi:hypothetical protein
MSVENVERSSWANWGSVRMLLKGRGGEKADVCGAEEPFALGTILDCDAGEEGGGVVFGHGG